MNRHRYIPILLLLASVLLSLYYCPIFDSPEDDKEVFRYGGLLLLKGGVLYRDLFDHKPPLIFFLNYAGWLLGRWGLWTIDLSLNLLSTLVFFATCRRHRLSFPWLLPLLFLLLIRDPLVCMGIGMTREFTSYFILLFFCVLLSEHRYKHYLLGVLAGLTFFTQQEQILTIAPFLVYAFWVTGVPAVTRRVLGVALGFCTVLLPIVIYFAIHGALAYFWTDSFGFNFTWYATGRKTFWEHFQTTKWVLDQVNYEVPFMVAAVLGIVTLFMPGIRKGLALAALASLAASLSGEYLGARPGNVPFLYYFLPLSAPICFVLFAVMSETRNQLISGGAGYAAYASLLCCSLVYTSLQHGTHLRKQEELPVPASPEMSYLRHHPLRDYQLYVMGNTAYLYAYNSFGILAPSPWIYQHFWKWYPAWDADQTLIRGIGQSLLSHHTTYVIMDTVEGGWFINPVNSKWWLSFMDQYYQQLPLQGTPHSLLWKIKDSVGSYWPRY